MLSDVIQTAKYGTATNCIANTFTDRNNFMHVKCLISEDHGKILVGTLFGVS